MLLVDLDAVPPGERVAAFHHAMTDDSVPNDIVHEETGSGIHARMELWRVGGLDLFATRNSGFELRRTAEHVRRQRSRPIVAVSLQTEGAGRAEVDGEQRLLGPDEVFVFHELTPRLYGWSGDGAGRAVVIESEHLGLPVELVTKAGLHLRASPLHDLVLQHLRGLWRDPSVLEADPGAPSLANATIDLVRALLISAASDERQPATRSVMDDTLLARVMAYARRHLTEADLTPERIAADHAISERHLYAVLRRAGISLEQWVITERLEEARRLLASVRHDHLTIAAVAARCGFGNASHFARRFHAAYGMTPREWRRSVRA
ncbi:AraC family transcriptional regulator [Streptomyces sp. NPDC088354]|uniref:AraC family transcriptional regulator n=1 Tax=unclassified Streptomyces TaxID=2593676 RepID=UPI0029B0C100|nr:AraC family transcriptional regulator [Streptomyces sp. MI02-7b]MDX3072834.1 AraC family transcriptional regulator [Streptomyces sp. MI02-7b]